MFREMRRFKQAISREECIDVLKRVRRGVLSVLGDDGYPYGVPMNFWYDEATGHICFHGAKEGHKQDAIAQCDKVSFTVYDEGYLKPGDWALNVKSVIIFGRIRIVEDYDRAMEIGRQLCYRFTEDESYIADEIAHAGPRVRCLELVPEHMTGKLVNEK